MQDAFVIAVEQQARERLERLSALKKIKPVDMTKLSQELNECANSTPELNGVIENNPIYVTTVPEIHNATLERVKKDRLNNHVNSTSVPVSNKPICDPNMPSINGHNQVSADFDVHDQELELKQEIVDSKDEEDDMFSPPSPKTPPHERLLIESQNERDSVTNFSQNCVSVETLLPNLPDKLRSMPNGNLLLKHAFRKSPLSDQTLQNASKVSKNVVKANGIEPEIRPHREMAVDVPDSFVGVAKTAPRYPPQKTLDSSDSKKESSHPEFFINSSGDSSSTENDPKISSLLPKSRLSNKSNFSAKDYISKQSTDISDSQDRNLENIENATEEQLERIRKYQVCFTYLQCKTD